MPARGGQVIPVRSGLDLGRFGPEAIQVLPRGPFRDSDVRAQAIERLDAAVADRERLSQRSDSARGTTGERDAMDALAAANERFAAREAWVKYIEHGY